MAEGAGDTCAALLAECGEFDASGRALACDIGIGAPLERSSNFTALISPAAGGMLIGSEWGGPKGEEEEGTVGIAIGLEGDKRGSNGTRLLD